MTLWYIARATGVVALVLLTITVSLGLANAARLHTTRIPRFVIHSVHRNASLLSVVFVTLHVATVILDGYVSIPVWTAVIPFTSSYKAVWLAFGTVSVDLLLAVMVTSLLRRRIGQKAWRTVHWLAYLSWPDAVVHSIGIGTDSGSTWMLAITGTCIALVLGALAVRWRARPGTHARPETQPRPGTQPRPRTGTQPRPQTAAGTRRDQFSRARALNDSPPATELPLTP
jgi:methionine sulfoxide reductase heme-binding subunit